MSCRLYVVCKLSPSWVDVSGVGERYVRVYACTHVWIESMYGWKYGCMDMGMLCYVCTVAE